MPAMFLELHKVQKKIVNALEPLTDDERKNVIAAALAIIGKEQD